MYILLKYSANLTCITELMKTNMPRETHLAKHLLISLPMALEKLVTWVGKKDLDKAPGKAAS